MSKMNMDKGTYGYVDAYKSYQLKKVLIWVGFIAAIFIVGIIVFKTRNNYVTILAVLLVLPAAKTLVAYVIMMPFKTDKEEYYEEIKKIVTDKMTLLSDLVVSKYEGLMMYSLMVVYQGNIYAYAHPQKIKEKQLKGYMTTLVRQCGFEQDAEIFESFEDFKRRITELSKMTVEEEYDNSTLLHSLMTIAV